MPKKSQINEHSVTDIIVWNILTFRLNVGNILEYFVEKCQPHRMLLWILIMLCHPWCLGMWSQTTWLVFVTFGPFKARVYGRTPISWPWQRSQRSTMRADIVLVFFVPQGVWWVFFVCGFVQRPHGAFHLVFLFHSRGVVRLHCQVIYTNQYRLLQTRQILCTMSAQVSCAHGNQYVDDCVSLVTHVHLGSPNLKIQIFQHLTWPIVSVNFNLAMLYFALFHNITCYTTSLLSCIHANLTEFCNIITLNVSLTFFVISCKKKNLGITHLQCYDQYHLMSDFSSKFQSSMTIFHFKHVTMQTMPNFVSIEVRSDDYTCEHVVIRSVIEKSCHSDTKYHHVTKQLHDGMFPKERGCKAIKVLLIIYSCLSKSSQYTS